MTSGILKQSLLALSLAIGLNVLVSLLGPAPSPLTGLVQRFNSPNTVKLYGSSMSTCTRRVALVLREKNIPYELIPVDMSKGEHKTPAYLESKQPFGQVPVIIDGNLQMFESRAIARYIAHKYASRGPALLPPPGDLTRLAQFEQAASIEQANFDAFASGIAAELVFIPAKGGKTDQKRVKSLKAALADKLDAYDKILSKQPYLAGNEITLADLFHLPYGTMITKKCGLDLLTSSSRPHVARWWNELSSRQTWLDVENGA